MKKVGVVGVIITSLCFSQGLYATEVCTTATVTTPTGTTSERVCYDNGVPTDYGDPSSGGSPPPGGSTGGGSEPVPLVATPTSEQSRQAICGVNTFGDPRYHVKSSYKIVYIPYFKWENMATGATMSTIDETSPGANWSPRAGDTDDPRYPGPDMTTIIFAHGYTQTPTKAPLQELIFTLGHEAAHQNGVIDENAADQAGQTALDGWKAVKGAGCR